MNNTLKTEQQIKDALETSFLPLQNSLSQNGAKRGPLWLAYHGLCLFSHWGEKLTDNDHDLQRLLGTSEPGNYTWFGRMSQAYKMVKVLSQDFDAHTIAKIGKLTENLRQFAKDAKTNKDGTMEDGNIFKFIIDSVNGGGNKDDLLDMIVNKQKEATDYAAQAEEVNTALGKYGSDLAIAEAAIEKVQTEIDSDSKTSQKKIDALQAGAEFEGSIAHWKKLRDENQKEYDHDVVVAATTPTYGWMFPLGTIAAATVAGVYGSRAVAALNKIKDAKLRIEAEKEDLKITLTIRGVQKQALYGIGKAKDHCNAAIKESEVVQSAWYSINGDLDGVAKQLKNLTGITDEGEKMKSKALVSYYATVAAKKWAELWPMIEELSNVNIGTHDFETMDPGEMADKIEKEMAQQNKATL